jgi:hypothetical protein
VYLAADSFRSTPPFGILAKRLGQPEHTGRLDESLPWKRTRSNGDRSLQPSRGHGHDVRTPLPPGPCKSASVPEPSCTPVRLRAGRSSG